MDLEKKIEAILFWKGEPLAKKKLAEVLDVKVEEVSESLTKIKESLQDRGFALLENDEDRKSVV